MPNDLTTEKRISLEDARKLPWHSKVYAFKTVWSWAIKGLKADSGEIVKLETLREGNRLVTSEDAIRRFQERLSEQKPTARTPSQAKRSHERAVANLAAMGFKSPAQTPTSA